MKFHTPDQVAKILQLNILTIYKYIRLGKLPAIKVGRSYRISENDLEQFLQASRVQS